MLSAVLNQIFPSVSKSWGRLTLLSLALASSPSMAATAPRCLSEAAAHYNVDVRYLMAISKLEGGWTGLRKPNSNGTYDLGVMQINTHWLRDADVRAAGITRDLLADNDCLNYWFAAWIFRLELNSAGNDPWRAVGNYHSRTPVFHQRYMRDAMRVFARQQVEAPSQRQEFREVSSSR